MVFLSFLFYRYQVRSDTPDDLMSLVRCCVDFETYLPTCANQWNSLTWCPSPTTLPHRTGDFDRRLNPLDNEGSRGLLLDFLGNHLLVVETIILFSANIDVSTVSYKLK